MPTINLEMMKQLLQEFSEKEALTTEEIGVIDKEVSNLEKRIEHCRTKLKNLSEDKIRLAAIQERYSNGKFVSPSPLTIKDRANEQIPKPTPHAKPAAAESLSAHLENSKPLPENETLNPQSEDSKASAHPTNKLETEPSESKTKKQTKPPDEEDGQENEEGQDASHKESGDTIKSINDALKGLFRK